MFKSIITRTGSYIPSVKVLNEQFLGNEFFAADGTKIAKSNVDIVNKLQEITCIRERRYVEDDLITSDIAFMAAEQALDGTDREGDELYIKMRGHDIYKYAVRKVPEVVKLSLDKAGLTFSDVKKVLIHQANQKMDEAILARLFKLYNIKDIPDDIMPMTISWLGNSSVATLPTMLDLMQRGNLDNHRLHSGDIVVFASVGAGMNINSMVYKVP